MYQVPSRQAEASGLSPTSQPYTPNTWSPEPFPQPPGYTAVPPVVHAIPGDNPDKHESGASGVPPAPHPTECYRKPNAWEPSPHNEELLNWSIFLNNGLLYLILIRPPIKPTSITTPQRKPRSPAVCQCR